MEQQIKHMESLLQVILGDLVKSKNENEQLRQQVNEQRKVNFEQQDTLPAQLTKELKEARVKVSGIDAEIKRQEQAKNEQLKQFD